MSLDQNRANQFLSRLMGVKATSFHEDRARNQYVPNRPIRIDPEANLQRRVAYDAVQEGNQQPYKPNVKLDHPKVTERLAKKREKNRESYRPHQEYVRDVGNNDVPIPESQLGSLPKKNPTTPSLRDARHRAVAARERLRQWGVMGRYREMGSFAEAAEDRGSHGNHVVDYLSLGHGNAEERAWQPFTSAARRRLSER